jgi:hypothetical protein
MIYNSGGSSLLVVVTIPIEVPKQAAKEVQQCTTSNPNWNVIIKLLVQKLAQKNYMF